MTLHPDLRAELDEARIRVEKLECIYREATGQRPDASHGTDAGYNAHRKIWLTPQCGPCRTAHSVVTVSRKASKAVNGHDRPDAVQERLF